MRHLLGTLLACPVFLVTAGCGDPPRDDVAQPQGSPTSSAPVPTASPTTPPSEGLEKLRVVGEVVGVGDCVVVRDDHGTTWTVTGDDVEKLVLHDRVQATGTPDLTATGCGGPLVAVTRLTVLPLPE